MSLTVINGALGRAVGRKFIFEPTLDACRREYDVRMG